MKTPEQEYNEAVKDLVASVNGKFGAVTELARKLSEETGQTVPRQYVQLWLHPKKEKRRHPGTGMGLILLRVGAGLTLSKSKTKRKRSSS
jgi:hypothetical protein